MINTKNLQEWVKANNIENRSIVRFGEYVNMYIKEIEDENSNTLKYINLKLMKVNLYKVSLSTIYNHSDIINVFLDISYCDKHIGKYEIVYTTTAEQTDEFLSFDDIHYIWRLSDVYNKAIEIAESALKEGMNENLIAKITGLSLEQIIELKKH